MELLIGENNLERPELQVENLWKWKDGDVVPFLMKETDFSDLKLEPEPPPPP